MKKSITLNKVKAFVIIFIKFIWIPFILILSGCQCTSVNYLSKSKAYNIPSDVDAYVHNAEKNVPEIKPNNEKKVYWYAKKNEPTEYSIVFIHGFASSRLIMEPEMKKLAKKMHANYFATRVSGHGQPSRYLDKVKAKDWVNTTQEAIAIGRKIGSKVIVIGHSTGCPAMATVMAQSSMQDLHSIVFISPNFGPKNRMSELILWPGGLPLVKKIHGKSQAIGKKKLTPQEEKLKKIFIKDIKASATVNFSTDSLKPMMEVVQSGRCAKHSNTKVPILFIYSEKDNTVNVKLLKKYKSLYKNSKVSSIVVEENKIDLNNHIHIGRFTDQRQSNIIQRKVYNFLKSPNKVFTITV